MATASAICVALVTSMRVTPAGVASDVGPATIVTVAPASAARASANPILPKLVLVMLRTGSINELLQRLRTGPLCHLR